MPATEEQLLAVDHLLDGAVLLGAELDPSYRVFAVTVEVEPGRHPGGAEVADHRLQVLFHPASTILASLRVLGPTPTLEAFTVEQLPDVVHALDGPRLEGPVIGVDAPGPGEWGPQASLEGRSTALDGHAHRLRFEVVSGERHFGIVATFDDVEVRTPDGVDVPLT